MDLGCEGTGEAVSFGILDDLLDRVTDRLDERLNEVLSCAERLEERVSDVIDEVFLFFFLWRTLANGLVQGGSASACRCSKKSPSPQQPPPGYRIPYPTSRIALRKAGAAAVRMSKSDFSSSKAIFSRVRRF